VPRSTYSSICNKNAFVYKKGDKTKCKLLDEKCMCTFSWKLKQRNDLVDRGIDGDNVKINLKTVGCGLRLP
jgi:hypothetical protein